LRSNRPPSTWRLRWSRWRVVGESERLERLPVVLGGLREPSLLERGAHDAAKVDRPDPSSSKKVARSSIERRPSSATTMRAWASGRITAWVVGSGSRGGGLEGTAAPPSFSVSTIVLRLTPIRRRMLAWLPLRA
jgi:hypothetical protein